MGSLRTRGWLIGFVGVMTVVAAGCFPGPGSWPTTTTTTAPTTTTIAATTTSAVATTTTVVGPGLCLPGFFSIDGNQPCTPAAAGFYVDAPGAIAAFPCPPGRYQSAEGQTQCLLAPIGTFVPFFGSVLPTPCLPGLTTLATGSISEDDCVPAGT